MKIRTDVKTLSRLYPIFEEAGIAGVLSGDFEEIKELTYPGLCGKLLKTGRLAEACSIITDSETQPDEASSPGRGKPWEEASREDCMGVIVPFLIDITIGQVEFPDPKDLETAEAGTAS